MEHAQKSGRGLVGHGRFVQVILVQVDVKVSRVHTESDHADCVPVRKSTIVVEGGMQGTRIWRITQSEFRAGVRGALTVFGTDGISTKSVSGRHVLLL